MSMMIGFIGQGWLGKNYADDFERRGFSVVRYSKEPEYEGNAEKIKECDIVFIAVPTPTVPAEAHYHNVHDREHYDNNVSGSRIMFDGSILPEVLPLVGKGKTAVVRSTLKPGTTKELQTRFPEIFVLHAPEFLAEKTAADDAAHPRRNIIGIPAHTPTYEEKAKAVLSILPQSPYELVTGSTEAELIKYAGNGFLMWKVLFANIIYDLAHGLGADYDAVREALGADPRIGPSHLKAVDESGHPGSVAGRGAGGHCFIKDFAVLANLYAETVGDAEGIRLLNAFEEKNTRLLTDSGKDLDLLKGVYGDA